MTAHKSRKLRSLAEALEPRRLFAAPGLNWPLAFDDEFNGTSLDSTKWTQYLPSSWGNNSTSGDLRYENSNYASYMEAYDTTESGGSLNLATTEQNVYSANGTEFNYTEAMLTTNSTFWHEYGYAEIRAELPTGGGNWPAFWSLSNGWPPENDIMEDWPATSTNHQGLYDMSSNWQNVYPAYFGADTWNTYGLEWGPGYEKFYENGNVTLSITTNVPSESMYFLLNSGVAADETSDYSSSNNNVLHVDYVRIYGYSSTPGPQVTDSGFDSSGGFSSPYGTGKISTSNPRTGLDDLEITSGSGGDQQTITGLTPGTTYTFSGWGYAATSGDYGDIGVNSYNGSQPQLTNTFAYPGYYGHQSVTFTEGSSGSATVFLYADTSGTTYYDDTGLEVTPTVTISPISNISVSTGSPVTIPLTVTETGSINNTTITASSSNTAVIPNSALSAGGTSSSQTLTVTLPAPGTGTSTITVDAIDPYGATGVQTFVVTALSNVTISGDQDFAGENDVFRLVRSGANLNLYQNNTTNTPSQSFTYTSTGEIFVNGLGGNNQLTLDYSGGDPVPAGGVNFNGGTGTNTLIIANMPGTEAANLSNGSLTIGSDIIPFSNTASLNLDLGSGSSTLFSTTGSQTAVLSLNVDAGATLTLGASSTLPTDSIVSIAATGTFKLASQSEAIDRLTGGGTLNIGSGTLTIGAKGGSSTFSGSIIGTGGLIKEGTGTFELAGSDNFTGAVTIGTGATSGGNVDGILQITTAAALSGVTQVNLTDNNSAYATLQLNSSGTSISLPSTLTLAMDANSDWIAGQGAPIIDSLAGTNKISGSLTFGVGGAGYGISVDSGTLTFAGPLPATSHVMYLRGAGTGSFTFGLTGAGSVVEAGPGVWTLNLTNSYSGYTNVSGGTLNISSGASLASTTINATLGGTLNVLGTLATTAAVTANGTVNFGPSTTSPILVRKIASLSIGSAGVVTLPFATNHQYRTLLVPAALTFAANTGTLDLSNNDLDAPGASLATLFGLVTTGYNFGTWTGTGITSSAAAPDSTHLTALGVIVNNAGGTPLYGSGDSLGTFDGTSPGTNDVLVKLTFYGDANLDGKVDGSDYSRIDSGSLSAATGWYNGDFNFSSNIDGSDYTLLDNAFNTQGSDLSTSAEIATPSRKPAAASFVPSTWTTQAVNPFASGNSISLPGNDQEILNGRQKSSLFIYQC